MRAVWWWRAAITARSSWLFALLRMLLRSSTSSPTRALFRLVFKGPGRTLWCDCNGCACMMSTGSCWCHCDHRSPWRFDALWLQGTVNRQAIDVSLLRRVNQVMSLLTIGVRVSLSIYENFLSHITRIRHAILRSAMSNLLPNVALMNSSMLPRVHRTRMLSRFAASL